jgi:4-hydroxy-2-oxoheptanedioate aldolase
MNSTEKEMVALLNEMRSKFHVTGLKAEFEAEGTRMEEAMRLKDVASKAGLGLNIKIGGCEAIKDMFDASALGSERIIGPMIETPYALKKFIGATRIAFGAFDESVEFLINLETETAFRNFDAMLAIPEARRLHGIVIGRVDLCGSMGLSREAINDKPVLDLALVAAAKAKAAGKQVVVGGGVSVHSLPFFRTFPPGHLDRFETRKVIFSCPGALDNPEEAFLKAVQFELLWLKNKKAYYGAIHHEDDARMEMMERRYRDSMEMARIGTTDAIEMTERRRRESRAA